MMKKENKRFLNVKTGAVYRKVYEPICCRLAGDRDGSVSTTGCIAIVGEVRPLSFERADCNGEAT